MPVPATTSSVQRSRAHAAGGPPLLAGHLAIAERRPRRGVVLVPGRPRARDAMLLLSHLADA